MLAIIVEGGLVQGIVTDDPTLLGQKVVILDYDCEGCEESEIIRVPQGPSLPVSDQSGEAWGRFDTVQEAGINLTAVKAQLEEQPNA